MMITVMDQMEVHGSCKLHAKDNLGGCEFSYLDTQEVEEWQRVWSHLRGRRWAQSLHWTLSTGKYSE